MMVTVEKIMKTRRGVEVKLYPFFNLEVGDQRRALAHLSPGKETLYSYRRLGKPQGRSGRVRKLSPPPVFDDRTVQPVAIRYTS